MGQPIRLHCEADGIPTPQIKWFKDNNPIEKNDLDFHIESNGAELLLRKTTKDHLGAYKCLARVRKIIILL